VDSEFDQLVRVYAVQSEIISIQKEVIDDLFRLLAMHLSADELDNLEVVGKINEAARLRRDYQ
jgi:hypothetical protein